MALTVTSFSICKMPLKTFLPILNLLCVCMCVCVDLRSSNIDLFKAFTVFFPELINIGS